jgi:hypothetical protein
MHDQLSSFRVGCQNGGTSASRLSVSFRQIYASLIAVLLLPALAMSLAFGGHASRTDKAKPWLTKDWTQWTADDCTYVLNGSPWSLQMYPMTVSIRPGEFNSSYTLVQLRSALPVRQALLRILRIEKHYDKMDEQKKLEFDQQNSAQLNENAAENVVVLIDEVNVYNGGRDLTGQSPATQVALRLADGTLVMPIRTSKVNYPPTQIQFDATHVQFEYVFARTAGGKPLYSPGDSVLAIALGAPLIVDKKTGTVETRDFGGSTGGYNLKISDLMYKGKLEY